MPIEFDVIPRGIGGGGSLFGPAINPANPKEAYVSCDMGQVFHCADIEQDNWVALTSSAESLQCSWRTRVDFGQGGILYACESRTVDGSAPLIMVRVSADGGISWQPVSFGLQAIGVFADPHTQDHVLFCTDTKITSQLVDPIVAQIYNTYIQDYPGGGASSTTIRVAGVYFAPADSSNPALNGYEVFVATDSELLCFDPNKAQATDTFTHIQTYVLDVDKTTFLVGPNTGGDGFSSISTPEYIISFAGGRDKFGHYHLYAVTVDRKVDNSDKPGSFHSSPGGSPQTTHLYYMFLGAGPGPNYWKDDVIQTWQRLAIPPNTLPQLVASAGDQFGYVASTNVPTSSESVSSVHRYSGVNPAKKVMGVDSGNSWMRSGWGGTCLSGAVLPLVRPPSGQVSFVNFSAPTGIVAVKETDTTTRLLLTDTAFAHTAIDDNVVSASTDINGVPTTEWQEVYLKRGGTNGANNAGNKIQPEKYYQSIGLETTVCTWLDAKASPSAILGVLGAVPELRVSFNDIASIVSRDGGATWSFAGEHWETPPGFDPNDTKKARMPGDVSQTVHYVDDVGEVHEFALRYHLAPYIFVGSYNDNAVNTPYSSVDAIIGLNVATWTGALHKFVPKKVAWGPSPSNKVHGVPSPTIKNAALWKNINANFGGQPNPDGDAASKYRRGALPTWVAIDENQTDESGFKVGRLYVAVAHTNPNYGGVWYCDQPVSKISSASTWTQVKATVTPLPGLIAVSPHPYNIRFLNKGLKMLVSQSGWLEDDTTYYDHQTSGVRVYTRPDLKSDWTEETAAGQPIAYDARLATWTQDVVIDPTDENIWYACVWTAVNQTRDSPSGQLFAYEPAGALYQRASGSSWSPIFPAMGSMSVTSCTRHPDPNNKEMYICTRYEGLHYCGDVTVLNAGKLVTERVEEYPFRAPLRVFYVERKSWLDGKKYYDVWVTSNGNGLYLVKPKNASGVAPQAIHLSNNQRAEVWGSDIARSAGANYSETIDDIDFIVERAMAELGVDSLNQREIEMLRAAVREQVVARLQRLLASRNSR